MSWTVWGVVEMGCWIGHFPDRWPTGRDVEECLDAHFACGIDHIAWELGRSALTYHSGLPDATCLGFGEMDGLNPQQQAVQRMFRERCLLRVALGHGQDRCATIYGRLCMNRHYRPGSWARSKFADQHPELCEIQKSGWLDVTRLCYGTEAYRAERVAILTEAAQIGVDGLCLDFCRQPPLVGYHPSLSRPFEEQTGYDPRRLSPHSDRDTFLAWCRHRAGAVTRFLEELKAALDPFRERYDRQVPVQARIPNDGFEANLIAGLDVERWCREGLVDELALSELHQLREYTSFDDRPYVELGHRHGLPVYASSNALPCQALGWGGEVNPRGINPAVLAQRALRSQEQGADGICLYQTDTAVRWPGLREVLPQFAEPDTLRELVEDEGFNDTWPVTPENEQFGIDNHSKPGGRATVEEW